MYSVAHKISLSWLIAIVISLLSFFVNNCSYGQTAYYVPADSIALAAPDSVESTVADLASYFNRHKLSTLEKARAAYRWITNEISYDTDALFSGWPGSHSLHSVLQDRIALCKGYTFLFSSLLDAFEIPNKIIVGDAKGLTFDFSNPELSNATKHVWNSFEIDGKWYLADATFGAGYINNTQKTFVKHFVPSYFLSSPEFFIYSHFPSNPKWQLLENPISEKQFLNLAIVTSHFNEFNLRFPDLQSNNSIVRQRTSLILIKPVDVQITCSLRPSKHSLSSYKVQENKSYKQIYKNRLNVETIDQGEKVKINMIFHEKKPYTLYIYAKSRTEPFKEYKPVAKIDFNNLSALSTDYLLR